MANEIVWYSSTETGAPSLNNVNGSLINVLDACLVNGFNSKSITQVSVAGGVGTAVVSAHGFDIGKIVEHAGVSAAGLNGRKKVLSRDSNTYTFSAAGVPDGTYTTGTMTAKRSPLGWLKKFAGTNKAIYARSDPAATTMVLRVQDDNALGNTQVGVTIAEGATDIDTMTAPWPAATANGGAIWQKGDLNNSTGTPWIIVGDSKTMYLFTGGYNVGNPQGTYLAAAFGDIKSYKVGDTFNCLMGYQRTDTPQYGLMFLPTQIAYSVIMRTFSGFPQVVNAQPMTLYGNPGQDTNTVYPSPVDNSLMIFPIWPVLEVNGQFRNPVRGEYRGAALPVQAITTSLNGQIVDYAGKSYLCVAIYGTGQLGAVMFDVTGPWS